MLGVLHQAMSCGLASSQQESSDQHTFSTKNRQLKLIGDNPSDFRVARNTGAFYMDLHLKPGLGELRHLF